MRRSCIDKGIVTEVNTGVDGPAVIRTVHIDTSGPSAGMFAQDVEAKELGGGGAALSPDGKTLVMTGQTGLLWVDTTTLRARSHQLTHFIVQSLGLSPDGSTVYALHDAGMIAELSMANPGVSTTFGSSDIQSLALLRVDSPPVP